MELKVECKCLEEEEKFNCEVCKDERVVEIMGDGDNFEYDCIGYKKCFNCQD